MTQLGTPYPSTAYLTGFLRHQNSVQVHASQTDLALALVLALLSPAGLRALQARAVAQDEALRSASVNVFLDHADRYIATVGRVIAFL